MKERDIAEFIQRDRELKRILHDYDIHQLDEFSNTRLYDDALREYIEKDYSESFKVIYNKFKNDSTQQGKIVALVRSARLLATDKLKATIVENYSELSTSLENAVEKLKEFKDALANNEDFLALGNILDTAFDSKNIAIINSFGQIEMLSDLKSQILSYSLDIADITSKASPTKDSYHYAIYNVVINNLVSINDRGTYQVRFDKHQGKISNKRTSIEAKYRLWVIVVIIFILIRILLILS